MLGAAEAVCGPNSADVAAVLDVLVEGLWRSGKAREAETLRLARRALRIREDLREES